MKQKTKNQRVRRSRFEQLETRELLAVTVHPVALIQPPTPAPALIMNIRPDSLVETAGAKPGSGTVRLNTGPASADTVVNLTSSDTTEATVPASVTIPKGYSFAQFSITPVPDATPDGTIAKVTITASAANFANGTGNVQIIDPSVVVKIRPDSIVETAGGKLGYGTVSLNTGPVAADTVVTLTSSDTTEATVPASVTIPKGYSFAQFSITPVLDTTPDGTKTTVTITASADTFVSGTANVQVVDPSVMVKIFPANISEAAGARPGFGVVYLNTGPATADTVITLASSNTGEATVPTQVTILKGHLFATFQVTAVPDTTADDAQNVTITASAAGFVDGSASVNVVDSLPHKTAPWSAVSNLRLVDAFFGSLARRV
jgi:hypothetical protein